MIEITDVFRGINVLETKPLDNPQSYVGEIWSYKGVIYHIKDYEMVYYLFGNPPKLSGVAFYTNVLGANKVAKK